MEAESIVLPQKLGLKQREKAEETGYLPEDLGIGFMLKSLNKDIDPKDLVEHYQSLSEKYLKEARELLKEGDNHGINLISSSSNILINNTANSNNCDISLWYSSSNNIAANNTNHDFYSDQRSSDNNEWKCELQSIEE